jgi:hypothetical protein
VFEFAMSAVMGVPWTGRTERDAHRNNIQDISAMLTKSHGADNYLVFNLRCVHANVGFLQR